MKRFRRVTGIAACAALVTVVSTRAAADVIDIAWSAAGVFERTVSVPAGKLVEVCGPLEPGQSVRWRFTADAPLDFDIHYHVGSDVTLRRVSHSA